MKLKGALLGAGNIALRGHAPQWTCDERLRDEVEIVAVADLSPSNLDAARALFPQARPYERAEDLLDKERLDFCDICTPPFTHRALVETAAARGMNLICEKPLAHTLEDALEIEHSVRRAGVVFQPCHQYHYSPQWQTVKELLPRIGRVYMVDYHVHRLAANEGNPHWDPSWRTDRDLAGGGILVDHGAHIFYQLRSVLGEPQTVQATVRTLLHSGYEVEDTAFVTLEFADRVAQVSLTWAARHREINFRFVGERGEITGDEERVRVQAEKTEEITLPGGMSGNSSHSEWYAPLLRDFSARIRSGDRGTGPLEEALYVTRLISRAYESCHKGCALPLAETNGGSHSAASDSEGAARVRAGAAEPIELVSPAKLARRRMWDRVIHVSALALVLAAVAWTFRDVRWAALATDVGRTTMVWVALAAAVNLIANVFQAARWLAVVRPLAGSATLGQAFKAMMVGFTVSMAVPARAGELARSHYLGLRTGLSRTSVMGSIVLDHLVNAAGLLAGLAVLPFFIGIPGWMKTGGWIALGLFGAVVMVVAALRPVDKDAGAAVAGAQPRRFGTLLVKLQHGLTGARQPRALAYSLAASLVAWTLEVVVVTLSLRAVGLDLPAPAAFLVLAAVNLALVFPIATPGNLGTLELGATLALIQFGVPKERALAFALCYHLLQVLPVAALGVAFIGRAQLWRTLRKPPVATSAVESSAA